MIESGDTTTLAGAPNVEVPVRNPTTTSCPRVSPSRSAMPAPSTNRYSRSGASSSFGVKATEVPSSNTRACPGISLWPASRLTVLLVTVAGLSGSVNTATIDEFTGMSDFPRIGQVRTTLGGRFGGGTGTIVVSRTCPLPSFTTIWIESPASATIAMGSNPPSCVFVMTGASSPFRLTSALTPPATTPAGSDTYTTSSWSSADRIVALMPLAALRSIRFETCASLVRVVSSS
jgi:hypothetical protein